MASPATPGAPCLAQLALARRVLIPAGMKRTLVILAALGLLGCFLPLGSYRGTTVSLVTLRHVDWLGAMLLLLGFAAPLIASVVLPTPRAVAITALVGFGYVVWKLGLTTIHLVINGSLGGVLIGVTAVGGLLVALVGVLDTQRARYDSGTT